MPRILIPTGPMGNQNNKTWNWCTEGEPLTTLGFVCDSSCTCGCSRSFIGTQSAKSCTQGIVTEVEEQRFSQLSELHHTRMLEGWNNNRDIADGAVMEFVELSDLLRHYPIGATLTVLRSDDSFSLHKVLANRIMKG